MEKILQGVLVCGIILFAVGVVFPIFLPSTINVSIGVDEFSDFPIGMWLQPILMGSGLCMSGIVIVFESMARKSL